MDYYRCIECGQIWSTRNLQGDIHHVRPFQPKKQAANANLFVLVGMDPRATDNSPEPRYIACHIAGGGTLVIWREGGNTQNIDRLTAAVDEAGWPVTVECEARLFEQSEARAPWQTYWVLQTSTLKVITEPKPSPPPSQPSDAHHTTPIFVTFIRNEIATGLLFAELSAGAGDHGERRTRHRLNAEKAYQSAAKFLDRTPTTADEAAELRVGLETLRAVIAALNEPG